MNKLIAIIGILAGCSAEGLPSLPDASDGVDVNGPSRGFVESDAGSDVGSYTTPDVFEHKDVWGAEATVTQTQTVTLTNTTTETVIVTNTGTNTQTSTFSVSNTNTTTQIQTNTQTNTSTAVYTVTSVSSGSQTTTSTVTSISQTVVDLCNATAYSNPGYADIGSGGITVANFPNTSFAYEDKSSGQCNDIPSLSLLKSQFTCTQLNKADPGTYDKNTLCGTGAWAEKCGYCKQFCKRCQAF